MKSPVTSSLSLLSLTAFAGFGLLMPAGAQTPAPPVSLSIQADKPAGAINPIFAGMMIEEINHSMDGGLYGELIQNRVFKDDAHNPVHWSPVGSATISLDKSTPLNDSLPVSLRLDASKATASQPAGVANEGFWGIPVRPNETYHVSFFAKASVVFFPVTVSIVSADGSTVYARAQTANLSAGWQPYSVSLTTGNVTATANARFVLTVDHPGTVWFNLVSLFPPTWNGRPNGLRPDLMQMLVDLKPGFLRLPGGNALEGDSIPNHFDWKKTVGPLAGRPGHQGPWGYRSSDGMGLLEYLEWAEDMGAEPLLAVYAGYSLDEKHVTPGPDLEPYVQDALDEIEYVTGSADTKWGAQRVKDGHPAPFTLHYVEIGNEDWFDRTPSYQARFAQIYKAIKAKYPQLQCISSIGNEHRKQLVTSVKPDLVDEHYYKSARDFEKMAPTYYEKYPRTPPYIFVGEWAAYEDIIPWDKRSAPLARTPAMKSALGDADWMAAMERNADIVKLQCYAPLLVNENPGASQWRPNLIGYDALNVYGSPSYYAIKMFNLHRGDTILKGTLDAPVTGHTPPPVQYSATQDSKTGMIYLKLVNFKGAAQPVNITLNGVTSISQPASVETLSANSLTDTNTMADPKKIVPVDSTIQDIKPVFTYTLSPYSITIIQMHAM